MAAVLRRAMVSGSGQALPEDGRLVACERDARPLELARRAWREAGVAHKVDALLRGIPCTAAL